MIKTPNVMFKRYTTLINYIQNLKNYDDFTTQAYLYKVGNEHFRKYVDIKRKNIEYTDNTSPDIIAVMQNPSFNNLEQKNKTVNFNGMNNIDPDITLKALISIIDDEQIKKKRQMNWIRIINLSDYEHSDSKKFQERFELYENTFQESHSIFGKGRDQDLKDTMKLNEDTMILIAWGIVAQQESFRQMAYEKLIEQTQKYNNKILGWKAVYDEKQQKLCWRYKYKRHQKIYKEIVQQQQLKEQQKNNPQEKVEEEKTEENLENRTNTTEEELQIMKKKYDPELQKEIFGYHHPLCTSDSNQKPYFSFKTKICTQILPEYQEINDNPVEDLTKLSKELLEKKKSNQKEDEEEKGPRKRQRRILKTEFPENRPKRELNSQLKKDQPPPKKDKTKKTRKQQKEEEKLKLKQTSLQAFVQKNDSQESQEENDKEKENEQQQQEA